jgi:hypothetical protein
MLSAREIGARRNSPFWVQFELEYYLDEGVGVEVVLAAKYWRRHVASSK